MGLAAAALGWRPAEFWASTPHEFYAAIEAFQEINGGKQDDSPGEKG